MGLVGKTINKKLINETEPENKTVSQHRGPIKLGVLKSCKATVADSTTGQCEGRVVRTMVCSYHSNITMLTRSSDKPPSRSNVWAFFEQECLHGIWFPEAAILLLSDIGPVPLNKATWTLGTRLVFMDVSLKTLGAPASKRAPLLIRSDLFLGRVQKLEFIDGVNAKLWMTMVRFWKYPSFERH